MTRPSHLRLVSSQTEPPPSEHAIIIGIVRGIYRVSVLFKQYDGGEKLGGEFATHGDALKYAHQLRLSKGWTVRDLVGEPVDF